MSTQRFGMENDGLTSGRFATIDRDLLDRLLAFFETHAHDGGANPAPLADPTTAPTATTAPTGGTLGNGQTRYYRVGFVDQYGLETAASDELAVTIDDTPAATVPPVPTGDTVSGSTLAADTYYYAVTVNSAAGESPLGPQAIITIFAGQNQANVALPALPSGGTSFNVWRMSIADVGWTKVGTAVTGTSFADTGFPRQTCPSDPTTQPPDLLVSTGTNAVTITVPDPDIVGANPSAVKRWRLYVTDTSGVYGITSLVAEVAADPGVALPTTVVDTGGATVTGTPLDISTALRPSIAVAGAGGGGGGTASGVVLTAPDHSTWQLTVANDGTLGTARLTSGGLTPIYTEDFAASTVVPTPPWTQFQGSAPLTADANGHLKNDTLGAYSYEMGTTDQSLKITYGNLRGSFELWLGMTADTQHAISAYIQPSAINLYPIDNGSYGDALPLTITGTLSGALNGSVEIDVHGTDVVILANGEPYATGTLPAVLADTKAAFLLDGSDQFAWIDQLVLSQVTS